MDIIRPLFSSPSFLLVNPNMYDHHNLNFLSINEILCCKFTHLSFLCILILHIFGMNIHICRIAMDSFHNFMNKVCKQKCAKRIFTSPDATASPGMNNSGYILSKYHLKLLQPNFRLKIQIDL